MNLTRIVAWVILSLGLHMFVDAKIEGSELKSFFGFIVLSIGLLLLFETGDTG